jgi:hypothetical protein
MSTNSSSQPTATLTEKKDEVKVEKKDVQTSDRHDQNDRKPVVKEEVKRLERRAEEKKSDRRESSSNNREQQRVERRESPSTVNKEQQRPERRELPERQVNREPREEDHATPELMRVVKIVVGDGRPFLLGADYIIRCPQSLWSHKIMRGDDVLFSDMDVATATVIIDFHRGYDIKKDRKLSEDPYLIHKVQLEASRLNMEPLLKELSVYLPTPASIDYQVSYLKKTGSVLCGMLEFICRAYGKEEYVKNLGDYSKAFFESDKPETKTLLMESATEMLTKKTSPSLRLMMQLIGGYMTEYSTRNFTSPTRTNPSEQPRIMKPKQGHSGRAPDGEETDSSSSDDDEIVPTPTEIVIPDFLLKPTIKAPKDVEDSDLPEFVSEKTKEHNDSEEEDKDSDDDDNSDEEESKPTKQPDVRKVTLARSDNGEGVRRRLEQRTSKTEKPERPERPERLERTEKPERPEKPERLEKSERPEKPERPERSERSNRSERPNASSERSHRSEQTERSSRQKPSESSHRRREEPRRDDASRSSRNRNQRS